MGTLVDERFDALRTQLFTGSTSDMILQWLQDSGATSGSVADAWREMLDIVLAAPTGNQNDDWFYLLGTEGHTGQINDREYAFWLAGGILPAGPV